MILRAESPRVDGADRISDIWVNSAQVTARSHGVTTVQVNHCTVSSSRLSPPSLGRYFKCKSGCKGRNIINAREGINMSGLY